MQKVRQSIIKTLKIVIRDLLVLVNDLLVLLPVKRNTYLFESFNGKDVSDNPAAIYFELIKEDPKARKRAFFGVKPGRYKELKAKYPKIQFLRRFMPKWIYYTARAQFWIFNSRMPTWWHKNRKTYYIQTWHGTPLKKLALDMQQVEMPGTNTIRYKKRFVKETKRWDYLIAPNQYSEDIFKHAFAFHHHFLEVGYPRNDILFRDNTKNKIRLLKQQLIGKADAPVITYAPTWRDDDYICRGAYRFELKFNLKKFFENVTPGTILVIRPHYLIKSKIKIPREFQSRVKVLRETDISKIYLISDLLITDYSSVMFSYANLKRPMIFYSYDLKHYQKTLRGFYFNYRDNLPGPLATNADAFYQCLKQYRDQSGFPQYQNKLTHFRNKFCTWDQGTASRKVIKLCKKLSH